MEDNFKRLRQYVNDREAQNKASRQNSSADHLKEIAEKRIKTTMIGAIAAIEEGLSQFWGNKKNPDDMTDSEYFIWEAFQKARDVILDKGNAQIRSICSEIGLFDINYVGHRAVFTKRNLNN